MSTSKLLYNNIVRRPLRTFALLFICIVMSAAVFGGAVISASLKNGLGSLEQRLGADIIVLPKSASEKVQLENAKAELDKPFVHEEELKSKSARLAELNAMLDLNKKDNEIVDGEREDEETTEVLRDNRGAR